MSNSIIIANEDEAKLQRGQFGEGLIVEATPVIRLYLRRAGDQRQWKQFSAGGGSISISDARADLSIGSNVGAYASLQSVRRIPYEPGTGAIVRFTAAFRTSPVANSFVVAGAYHGEAGLGVGFNGTEFSFYHAYGQRFEVQKLTITIPSAGAETASVTINGTLHLVPLTGVGSVQDDAREIAEFGNTTGYADAFVSYDAWAVDDTVYFIRLARGVPGSPFTFSSSGSCVAGFTTFQAGANGTQNWIPQADWNNDTLGAGSLNPSGLSHDSSDVMNLAIYELRYGWLGSLPPQLWCYPPGKKIPVLCHVLELTGPDPWCADPRFPLQYAVASLGSTTPLTLSGVSASALLEGPVGFNGPKFPRVVVSGSDLSGTLVPLVAVQTAPVDLALGKINRRRLLIRGVSVSTPGTKDIEIAVYKCTTSNLTGYKFSSQENASPLWVDTSSSAFTGTPVSVLALRTVTSRSVEEIVFDSREELERGEVMVVLGRNVGTGTGADFTVSIVGSEDP